MKRLVFGAAFLALGACASPTVPARHAPAMQAPAHDGEPCVTADGRSGYMVTAGFEITCQPF